MIERYHVQHGAKRTTVSLDYRVTELLALKLGHTPDSDSAHRAIQQWLQHRLNADNDPGRQRISRWLQSQAVYFLADRALVERHGEWLLYG